ncbi:hypothetical protein [Turicimonas muris]|nr:hypothetical protein [Turicimonas muris]
MKKEKLLLRKRSVAKSIRQGNRLSDKQKAGITAGRQVAKAELL